MKFVNFITVSETYRTWESIEKHVNDELFPDDSNSRYNLGSIESNKKYKKPDYTRHIIAHKCYDVFFMDEKNIPIPVSCNDTMDRFAIDNLTKDDYSLNKGAGIYIIERYIVNTDNAIDFKHLIEHYKNISKLTKETIESLEINLLNPTPKTAVIRLVVYIPARELDEHKYIYSEHSNLCFVKGLPKANVKHPNSKIMKKINTINKIKNDDSENIISIDMIDNENHGKPYFIKVGKDVFKLYSTYDSCKKSGANIIIKNNDIIRENIEYSLSDIHLAGIYSTKDEAIVEGNVEAIIKLKKLELEDKKLSITDRKVDIEDVKLKNVYITMEHEKEMMLIEKELKYAAYKAISFKSKIEYLSSSLDFTREKILFEEKLNIEKMKTAQTAITGIYGILKLFL